MMAEKTDILPPFSPRQVFGAGGTAWMEAEVTGDGEEVYLKALFLGGDTALGMADVLTVLQEQYHLRTGIARDRVAKLVDQAVAHPTRVVRNRQLIAQATPPGRGADGRVVFLFQDRIAEQTHLPYRELRAAFGKRTLEEVVGWDLAWEVPVPYRWDLLAI